MHLLIFDTISQKNKPVDLGSYPYQEVFSKTEILEKLLERMREQETKRQSIYDLAYVAIAMFRHQSERFLGNLLMIAT